MSEEKVKSNPPKRGGIVRKLIWILGIFVILLVVAFFVVTSGAFVKGVILPKVGAGMNADLTASDVSLSPFSQVELRNVKLTPHGAETLLTAGLVRARYSLFSIIGGNINVSEVTVESPVVTVVQNADGTSNLDPLTKGQKAEKEKAPAKSSKPPKIDIKTVALKNATIKQTKKLKDGGHESLELNNVNVTLADLKNGGTGKVDLAATIAMENTGATNSAALQAKLSGNFAFDLTTDLKPGKINGKGTFEVTKADGAFAEFASIGATLDADATPTEIKQIALRFTQSGQPLGEVTVKGPMDAAKSEGKLEVAILSLDRRVLNLAGATSGIDFGTTVVNSTNVIELTSGGKIISASGGLTASKMRITRQKESTPTLDFKAGYALTVDNTTNTVQLHTLSLTGTQDGRPLLQTELTSPMIIALGGGSAAAGDAALNVTLTGLNLADWRAFAADLSPSGTANAKIKLATQKGGKILQFNLDAGVTGLSAKFGSNSINNADITLRANGTGTDMKQFKLDEYRAELVQGGQPAVTVSGTGTFDRTTQDADLQLLLQSTLKNLLAMFPQPDANLSGGTVELKGHVTSKKDARTVTGQFTLADLKGRYGKYNFTSFGIAMDLDLGMSADQVQIRKAAGTLRDGAKPGGEFEVSGNIQLGHAALGGNVNLKLSDLNQNGLRPFLESMFADKKLISVSVNSTASATFDSTKNDATVKGDFQVANLVVSDATAKPLEVKAQLDAGVAKSVAQIRQCQLTFTPTELGKNEVKLAGSVDYTQTNAVTGNLKLTADSLDLTRYYDLFGSNTNQATAAKPTPAPAPAPSGSGFPDKEPESTTLPFKNFTVEATIGRFYLRELDATNLQAVVKIDGGHVLIKPAQLAINGAPLDASVDLDLGVAGYRYDVSFTAKAVPLAPLVNTFQPERKGQLGGHFTANAAIKGAGITGPNLKKNLGGQFDMTSTNLNLSVVNIKSKPLKLLINLIAALPELLKNPTAGANSLVGSVLGASETRKGGLMDELSKSPINVVDAKGNVTAGVINLDKAFVQSSSFQAEANGTVTLADVLTNSTLNVPVHVWLQRGLADRYSLVPSDSPTNEAYVKLPDYIAEKGTVGEPKADIKYAALAGTAFKVIGGSVVGLSTNIGSGLKGLGDALLKPKSTDTNAPASTNKSNPVGNLLQGLEGFGKKPKATNQQTKPK